MAAGPKRRVALLIALAAILAGGTAAALGATGNSPRAPHRAGQLARRAHAHQGILAAAASYLGASPSQLRGELASGKTLGQIAAASPGHSESGLLAALVAAARQNRHSAEARITGRIESLVSGHRGAAARLDHPRLHQLVLAYLGIPGTQLRAQLHAGMTLAQIADATPGHSASGLRTALLSALRGRLEDLRAAHAISARAEQRRLPHMESRVTALLARSHPAHSSKPAA